ncbi:hypothetical protein R1CP_13415 [Rhodococcus opacus]|uniref:Uncharacterized protein n=1 Tax=Rhodococcus opacus TaxID=37919 RepID=A0A1B1K444_RHOOP|nr:hypothetical protein [Rhodococcus opacus]ANS27390.1 hypothetical protein R1CP_13415 [Rhodococcus opacus]
MPGSPLAKNRSPVIVPTTTRPDAVRMPAANTDSLAAEQIYTNRFTDPGIGISSP